MDRKNLEQLVQGLEMVARSCEVVNPELDRRELVLRELSSEQRIAYAKAVQEAARGVADVLFMAPDNELFEPLDPHHPSSVSRKITVPGMGKVLLEQGLSPGESNPHDYQMFVASDIETEEQDIFSQRYLLKKYFFHPQLLIASTKIDRVDFDPSINDIITVEDSLENFIYIKVATLDK